ncbi:hypothetical protein KY334_08345, partial [Candidatus Woesearchaeota archaeon]|nr:hypothetical protein [Candidatus Woesearchaeota archaeon]
MRVNELISKIKEYYKKNKTRIDYLFSVIFLPLTFIITFLIRNYHVFLYESTKTGDYAANGLQIIRAGMFKELLGPYSRFEFNHPGPISFYYYAFMEKILFFIKHDSAKHFLSQFLINSIFIIISLHIIHTSFKKNKTRNTIIFFTLILFFIKYIGLYKIISLWGPDIILFPMLLFILSSSKVAQGNLKHLILSIISSVFIVHNQLGGLITVIPIFTLSILFLINQKRKEKKKITKKDWRIIIYSGALSFISLFPIFVDQLFYNKNLSKIFTFFKQNAGIQHSFLESSKFIIDFIINPLPEILKINTIIILSFFLTITIFGFNKKNKFLNITILFVYFSIFLSIYGAMKVVGDLLPYLFNYIHMIILIFYFIIVIST